MSWLTESDLRIGLGCMRLSTDESRDEETALATIAAADEGGMTVFDTAHAYGHDVDRDATGRDAGNHSVKPAPID